MSKANPRKAMAALLPLPIQCGTEIVVRPMTLGMWAALERIGSPLVTGEEPKDSLELIPSLYLLTHDPRDVFAGNILDLAMRWADSQPVTVMADIRKAAYRQMNAAFDVIPEDTEDDQRKKKRPTVGSSSSRNGAQRPAGGATAQASGKSRWQRSASSGGRKA